MNLPGDPHAFQKRNASRDFGRGCARGAPRARKTELAKGLENRAQRSKSAMLSIQIFSEKRSSLNAKLIQRATATRYNGIMSSTRIRILKLECNRFAVVLGVDTPRPMGQVLELKQLEALLDARGEPATMETDLQELRSLQVGGYFTTWVLAVKYLRMPAAS